MIVNFKYFFEKSDTNYVEYEKVWSENRNRMIYLQKELSLTQQMKIINNETLVDKDILAIRFPSRHVLHKNKIIENIMLGKGICCSDNTEWYPKEVWIYSPLP